MKKPRSSGFTLIEVAIVLVIIGLLLGGVLATQELIRNTEYRRLTTDIDSFRSALYSFRSRYGGYPGDLSASDAQSLLDSGAGYSIKGNSGNSTGNSIIDGGYCNNDSATEEVCYVWHHLRVAGLLSGDANDTGLGDETPVGGIYNTIATGTWGDGKNTPKLLMQNVSGAIGQQLDRELDDGDPRSGKVTCYNGGAGGLNSGCSSWNTDGVDAVFVAL